MWKLSLFILIFAAAAALPAGAQKKYDASWESLDSRATPAWFDEAKFGIFIHWGVYSVPAWGPKGSYAEWYWHSLMQPGSATREYHDKTYGADFRYQDFAPMFKAELFDPDQWADVLARSGAKYVVLTSKHHEGFCLWPSRYAWNWNAWDIGAHRDLAGELTKAVRAKGLRMGFYYSLYEWYNPLYYAAQNPLDKYTKSKKDPMKSVSKDDLKYYVDAHMIPQMKELINAYKPSVLWTDGEWDWPSSDWRSTEFLAWLFNESPVKEEIVINDRWGSETRTLHGGIFTSEYGGGLGKGRAVGLAHKWEENRGIGRSFGFNRNEDAGDYETAQSLIHMLADVVSRGGNLLLDIGPTADGRIPVIMQQRLLEMGEWLKINGEAIYGTAPWRETSEGDIRYTSKGGTLYAVALKWPGKQLALSLPKPDKNAEVTILGRPGKLKWAVKDGKMTIDVPPLSPSEIPCQYAWVFRITGAK